MAKDRLVIFDTTLRDGEQSPGASMNGHEKLQIAKMLENLRVDVIEAGFPIASPGDFKAVNAIAKEIKNSTICGLSRALDKDIDAAAEALKPAASFRIHTFLATSPIHMKAKLNMSEEQVLQTAVKAVTRARNYTDNVEFSAEDAGRSELDFLCKVIEQVIAAGATTINIPDTVGYTLPFQYGELIKSLIERVPNSDKAIFSVHCHNDLGLAVANSLSAVLQGARQVECTINGIGERAGNAALEEIVMAVKTRKDVFPCDTNIDTKQIMPCSRLVSNITGFKVQPNKAIVGANAFSHESGIHQDGVLKHRETYEIMRAEDVGLSHNTLVLGKLSGRNAFKTRMQELGAVFANDEELNQAFAKFKDLADKKHEIYDEDLLAIMTNSRYEPKIKLQDLQFSAGLNGAAEAKVKLIVDDQAKEASATGNGPVDAAVNAIEKIATTGASLDLFSINAVSQGVDAQGNVNVRLLKNGHLAAGHAVGTDIVVTAAKAYVDAVNGILAIAKKK